MAFFATAEAVRDPDPRISGTPNKIAVRMAWAVQEPCTKANNRWGVERVANGCLP